MFVKYKNGFLSHFKLVLFQRTDCVSISTHCRGGSVQSYSFRSPAQGFRECHLPKAGSHSTATDPTLKLSPLRVRPHFKLGFQEIPFFPSGFVSTGHGGQTYPRGHVPSYLPLWITTGPLWWGWGSTCSCPGIWSNPAGQGNPNSPTCAELT